MTTEYRKDKGTLGRSHLWKGKPFRELTVHGRSNGGRNNQGIMTTSYRGGGHKKRFRIIDAKRNEFDGVKAKVVRLEYNPHSSAHLALIEYQDKLKTKSYIVAAEGMKSGDIITSDVEILNPRLGYTLPLQSIDVGTELYNIEITPGNGGVIARSGGTFCKLLGKESGFAILSLPSKEVRRVSLDCRATIGHASNEKHRHESMVKAGRNRHKGIRPRVNKTNMNPVDHCMGGRSPKPSFARSNNNICSKGGRTRRKRRSMDISKRIIRRKTTKR